MFSSNLKTSQKIFKNLSLSLKIVPLDQLVDCQTVTLLKDKEKIFYHSFHLTVYQRKKKHN